MTGRGWGILTSADCPDEVWQCAAFLHEELNPRLLEDGLSQHDADEVLRRITRDLFAAANKASPDKRGDAARYFAARAVVKYAIGGHLTH